MNGEYIRHTQKPEWGVGVLVGETRDQRTYLFEDGVKRTFKTALIGTFIVAAPPPSDEDQARLARGLSAGGIATPIAINLELEAEIRKNLDDAGPYIVYADWLQQRKDPRGYLIAVQEQLARDPGNKKLRDAEQALFAEHGSYLMPEVLYAALRAAKRGDDQTTRCSVGWHMGFIERARLAKSSRQQIDLFEVADALLGHPSTSFIRELVLGPLGTPNEFDYTAIVAAIARHRLLHLESLFVGDFTLDHMEVRYTNGGDLSPIAVAAPNLQALTVRAGNIQFVTVTAFKNLRTLRVFCELAPAARDALFATQLPALETLELGGERVKLRAKDIQALAANASLEHLRELVIRNSDGTQTILNALIGSPLLQRLDTLVLADGDLGDKAVAKLERHAAKFAHLTTLDLSGNPLSPASALKITRLVGAVVKPAPRGTLTEAAALRRTNDPRNAAAARELADASKWLALGRHGTRVWGEYEGRDHYYVFAQLDDRRCGCSCGSPRSPCKHALALLLLAARDHAFVERAPPEGLVRHASVERPRYWSVWE